MDWYYIVIDVTAIHNELEIQLSNFYSKVYVYIQLSFTFVVHLVYSICIYLYSIWLE